jgi:hypothetical protein
MLSRATRAEAMQASTTAEEERIGVNFADLWKERQEKDLLTHVDQHNKVVEGAKELAFPSQYSQGCA